MEPEVSGSSKSGITIVVSIVVCPSAGVGCGVPPQAARATNMRLGNRTAICLAVSMIMPWDKYRPWVKVGSGYDCPTKDDKVRETLALERY